MDTITGKQLKTAEFTLNLDVHKELVIGIHSICSFIT